MRHAAALLEAGGASRLEGLRRARHVVLDEGDLRGRAAHVEGQDAVAAVAGRQVGGEDGATGRTGLDEAHRERGRNLDVQKTSPGVDEIQRAGGAETMQFGFEASQVGRHEGLHVGVGTRGVEALELAHLRRDLAADRHRDVRVGLQQKVAEAALVVAVAVAVHEPGGDGLVAAVVQFGHDGAGARLIERHEHVAVGVDAFGDHEAVLALDQRRRQHDVEVVLLEATLGAGLDHVAEPGGGDQRGPRAAPFDESVCGECCPVDDLGDLREVHAVAGRQRGDPGEDALLGPARRQDLGGGERAVVTLEHDIGEGPPDIGADAKRHD